MTRRLEVLMLAAALLFSIACATGKMRAPAHAADKDARLVAAVWYNPPRERWQTSGWYRVFTDVATPMRVVVSTDSQACVMGTEVNEPRPGDYYVCPVGWRVQSHVSTRP